jgi:hypothetical protein
LLKDISFFEVGGAYFKIFNKKIIFGNFVKQTVGVLIIQISTSFTALRQKKSSKNC